MAGRLCESSVTLTLCYVTSSLNMDFFKLPQAPYVTHVLVPTSGSQLKLFTHFPAYCSSGKHQEKIMQTNAQYGIRLFLVFQNK